MEKNCIFCQIAAGQADGKVVYRDDSVTAFWDRRPIAPVHILVIPNQHIDSANELQAEHEEVLGHLVTVASRLASEMGVSQSGYRLVLNTGPDAGQTVHHLHLHLIGGRHLPFHFT